MFFIHIPLGAHHDGGMEEHRDGILHELMKRMAARCTASTASCSLTKEL